MSAPVENKDKKTAVIIDCAVANPEKDESKSFRAILERNLGKSLPSTCATELRARNASSDEKQPATLLTMLLYENTITRWSINRLKEFIDTNASTTTPNVLVLDQFPVGLNDEDAGTYNTMVAKHSLIVTTYATCDQAQLLYMVIDLLKSSLLLKPINVRATFDFGKEVGEATIAGDGLITLDLKLKPDDNLIGAVVSKLTDWARSNDIETVRILRHSRVGAEEHPTDKLLQKRGFKLEKVMETPWLYKKVSKLCRDPLKGV